MKIKQIAVASDVENGETLYILCENGNLYEKVGAFTAAQRNNDGSIIKESFFTYWLKPVDLPIGDPRGDK